MPANDNNNLGPRRSRWMLCHNRQGTRCEQSPVSAYTSRGKCLHHKQVMIRFYPSSTTVSTIYAPIQKNKRPSKNTSHVTYTCTPQRTSTSRAPTKLTNRHANPPRSSRINSSRSSQPYKHPGRNAQTNDRHVGGKVGFWQWKFLQRLSSFRPRRRSGYMPALVAYALSPASMLGALSGSRSVST